MRDDAPSAPPRQDPAPPTHTSNDAPPLGVELGRPWSLKDLFALWSDPSTRRQRLLHLVKASLIPLGIFFATFVLIAAFSWNRFNKPSGESHFAYLSHTFLDRLSCGGAEGKPYHLGFNPSEKDPAKRRALIEAEQRRRCERAERLEVPLRPDTFYKPHSNDWASYTRLTLKGEEKEVIEGFFLPCYKNPRNLNALTRNCYTDIPNTRPRDRFRRFRTLKGETLLIRDREIDRGEKVSVEFFNKEGRLQRKHRAHEKRFFMSFPPMPSVLMTPFIALADGDEIDLRDPKKVGINDVQFTVFFAALNVMLFFLLLEHLRSLGVSERTPRENLILTFLFGFGTNALWCSVLGQVWFTALVVGMTFSILYIWASIQTRHPLLAGLFLGLAMATRTPLAFGFVFFAWFLFFPNGKIRRSDWKEMFQKGILFSIPILSIGAWLMWMNTLRFHNAFEFGHTYLAGGLRPSTLNYGLFNYHFLSKNLHAAFTLLPRIQPDAPYIILSKHGMSLFATTPAFIYLFAYRSGPRQLDRKWLYALVITLLAISIPGFFYQNTGWSQFGFRFSLDYTPYLVLLLALNRRRIGKMFILLVLLGFLVNAFGAVTFGRMGGIYENWLIEPDSSRASNYQSW